MADTLKQHRIKTTPKDFFLHLLTIVMLYISAFAFGNILFTHINFYFPDQLEYYHVDLNRGSLQWALSSIIIAFPAYILATRYLYRQYRKDPERKNVRIKAWLEYLTVFGAALIILVALMLIINKYLGGELTTRFVLKTATVLYIAGTVFGYYYLVIKNGVERNAREIKIFSITIFVIVGLVVALGFVSFGSPAKERARRLDEQRLNDLQAVSSTVIEYYRQNRQLPATLEAAGIVSTDPVSGKPYEYIPVNDLQYQLCANFSTERSVQQSGAGYSYPLADEKYPSLWDEPYTQGRNCFDQIIDPAVIK